MPLSITNLQNLGHQEPGTFSLYFERQLFSEATIYFEFPTLIKMVMDSRLQEWYSILEDQCFVDQLHQAVSIFLLQFCLMKFEKSEISQAADYFLEQSCHFLQGFSDLQTDAWGSGSHSEKS